MKISKKIFIFLILVVIVIFVYKNISKGNDNILPVNINDRVVLDGELFILTNHGLIEKGQIINDKKWAGVIEAPSFDKKHNIFYFHTCRFLINSDQDLDGIYSVDITKHPLKPKFLVKTKGGDDPSISPDGHWLVFCFSKYAGIEVRLLNLVTNKLFKVTDDYKYNPIVWINNHQFFYNDKKEHLILFDINTMTKKDMKMNGCTVGAVTPDSNYILLSPANKIIGGKTILYGIKDHSKKIIMNNWINTRGMVWTSDGKGFLYQRRTWGDFFHLHEIGGLFYYSLEKKRDVRLIKTFDLTGGFVVPSGIDLEPVDNDYNKDLPLTKWGWIEKIGKKQ